MLQRILKKTLICSFIFIFLLCFSKAGGLTLKIYKDNNLTYQDLKTVKIHNKIKTWKVPFETYTLDSEIAFCVDPGVYAFSGSEYYPMKDKGVIPKILNDKYLMQKLGLIASLGFYNPIDKWSFDNKVFRNDKFIRNNAYTQMLIWQTLIEYFKNKNEEFINSNGINIIFDEFSFDTTRNNFLAFKKDINETIEKIFNPQFSFTTNDKNTKILNDDNIYTFVIPKNHIIKIQDKNFKFSDWDLVSNKDLPLKVDKNNDVLTISSDDNCEEKEYNIKIRYKGYLNADTLKTNLFYQKYNLSKPHQIIAKLQDLSAIEKNIKIRIYNEPTGQIKINKKDARLLDLKDIGEKNTISDLNCTYKIIFVSGENLKYKAGQVVDTVNINNAGYGKSKELPSGIYDIIEDIPPNKFIKNPIATRVKLVCDSIYNSDNAKVYVLSGNFIESHDMEIDRVKKFNSYIQEHNLKRNAETFIDEKEVLKFLNDSNILVDNNKNKERYIHLLDNVKMGRIKIHKCTDTEKTITSKKSGDEDNAIFNILDEQNKIVDKLITNEKGIAESKYLPIGKYKLKQEKGEIGFLLSDDIDINIEEDKVISYEIKNKIKDYIVKLQKVDEISGKEVSLNGIQFKLFDENYNSIGIYKTDEKGLANLGKLGFGKYYIDEVYIPDGLGYYLDKSEFKRIEINITDKILTNYQQGENIGTIIVYVPQKRQYGQINIFKLGKVLYKLYKNSLSILENKYDVLKPEFIEKPISGVEFSILAHEDIYNQDKTLAYRKNDIVYNGKTDENGNMSITKLPFGQYEIIEKETALGYLIDTKPQIVELKEGSSLAKIISKTIRKENKRDKLVVKFNKTFENSIFKENSELYKSTYFALMNENNISENNINIPAYSYLDIKNPEKNNDKYEVSFDVFFKGNYIIRELLTDAHYKLSDDKKFSFEYKPNSIITQELDLGDLKNELARKKIKIIKVDSDTDKPLNGVEFELLAKNKDNISLGKYKTDSEGNITINNLEIGDYLLKETRPLKGYKRVSDKDINLNEDLDIKIKNSRTELTIEKTNSKGVILKGAKLSLEDSNGDVIDSWVSNDKAKVIFGLIPGQTYILREIYAPNGYYISKPLNFIFKDNMRISFINERKPSVVNIPSPKTGDKNSRIIMLFVILLIPIIFILNYKIKKIINKNLILNIIEGYKKY